MTWIYAYPAWLVAIAATVFFSGIAVAMTAAARRFVSLEARRSNDVAGAVTTVAGTLLAVLLSFMLVSVWAEAVQADQSATNEATAVATLERVASELPQPERKNVRTTLHAYASAVVHLEWPAMREGRVSALATAIGMNLLPAVLHYQPRSYSQQVLQGVAIDLTGKIADARRDRRFDNQQGIPMVLWAGILLIVLVTFALNAIFSIKNGAMHFTMSAAVGVVIAIVLALTAEFDYPFRGDLQLPPTAWHNVPGAGDAP